jgi:hypothetical protein
MRQKPGTQKPPADKVAKDIRRRAAIARAAGHEEWLVVRVSGRSGQPFR